MDRKAPGELLIVVTVVKTNGQCDVEVAPCAYNGAEDIREPDLGEEICVDGFAGDGKADNVLALLHHYDVILSI